MATSATPNPTATQTPVNPTVKVLIKEVFDLNTMDTQKIGIPHVPSAPFTDLKAALAYWGNDEAKIATVLNAMKDAEEEKAALSKPYSEFFALDSEKNLTAESANVLVGHEETVNSFILNLAKQQFGYARGKGGENNRKAWADAVKYIQGKQALRLGLVAMSEAMQAEKLTPPTPPTNGEAK